MGGGEEGREACVRVRFHLPTTKEEKKENVKHYQKLRIRRGVKPGALCGCLLLVLRCELVGGEAEGLGDGGKALADTLSYYVWPCGRK